MKSKKMLREIWSFHIVLGKHSIFFGIGEVRRTWEKPTVNPLEASRRLALSEGQKEQNRMKR